MAPNGESDGLFDCCKIAFVASKSLSHAMIQELSALIQKHGGEIGELDEDTSMRGKNKYIISGTDTTHVVANTIDFPQYPAMQAAMIPVVTVSWVTTSVSRGKLAQLRPYSPDPRMIFSNVVVTCADIPSSDKEAIIGATMALGGMESKDLTRLTTHICALSMDHPKCQEAAKKFSRCKIVLPHWFDDCFKLGKRIDEGPYLLPDPEILKRDLQDKIAIPTSQHLKGASSATPDKPLEQIEKSARGDLDVFSNKKIMLSSDLPMSEHLRTILLDLIATGGGEAVDSVDACDMFVCQYRDGAEYVAAAQSGKHVGNLAWLYHLVVHNEWTDPLRRLLHYPVPRDGIPGFREMKIALSNYGGEARIYLENLIVAAGATYTKTMKSDNTHLITARRHGEKCEAAQEWNIHTVNHLWVEESYARCEVQSLSERRYTHFPPRTNLGEVAGETFFDEKRLREMFYPGVEEVAAKGVSRKRRKVQAQPQQQQEEAEEEAEEAGEAKEAEEAEEAEGDGEENKENEENNNKKKKKTSKAKKQDAPQDFDVVMDDNTNNDNDDSAEVEAGAEAETAEAEAGAEAEAAALSLNQQQKEQKKARAAYATPARKPRSYVGEGKENETPSVVSSTGGRSAKAQALSKLQDLAPDIALYEKEKKRAMKDGSAPWGGKRAADQIDKEKLMAARSSSPLHERPENDDPEAKRPAKKHKSSLPPVEMRICLTGYKRWVGEKAKEDKEESDRRKLRSMGIQIITDNGPCDFLAAPRMVRTEKFLRTLARGPEVINSSFVDACLDSGKLARVEDHLLRDTEMEEYYGVKIKQAVSRARANKGRLLRGVAIYCTAEIKNGHGSYQAIAEANGAIFKLYRARSGTTIKPTTAEEEGGADPEPVYLLTSALPAEKPLWARFEEMARRGNMEPRIVVSDWLLNVAMRQELLFEPKYLATEYFKLKQQNES